MSVIVTGRLCEMPVPRAVISEVYVSVVVLVASTRYVTVTAAVAPGARLVGLAGTLTTVGVVIVWVPPVGVVAFTLKLSVTLPVLVSV